MIPAVSAIRKLTHDAVRILDGGSETIAMFTEEFERETKCGITIEKRY